MPDAPDPGEYYRLDTESRRQSDLWRAVVVQAIRDMGASRGERSPEKIAIELEAVQWLDSDDFDTCCQLALIDAAELRLRLKDVLQMKNPYRRLLLRDLADLLRDSPPVPEQGEAELDYGLASETEFDPV